MLVFHPLGKILTPGTAAGRDARRLQTLHAHRLPRPGLRPLLRLEAGLADPCQRRRPSLRCVLHVILHAPAPAGIAV